jgi:hypothetical protein
MINNFYKTADELRLWSSAQALSYWALGGLAKIEVKIWHTDEAYEQTQAG